VRCQRTYEYFTSGIGARLSVKNRCSWSAEETHAWPNTCEYCVKTCGLADVSTITAGTMEANTCRSIMRQHNVHPLTCCKPLHLVVSVVAPGVASKCLRIASVVGRTITPTNPTHTDTFTLCTLQFHLASVA
jgi:hypothetical protein